MPEKRINKPKHVLEKQKENIYAKYNDINPDFNIQTVNEPGKTIQHIIDNDEEYKYCSKCETWIPLDKFPASINNWDKKDRQCKTCKNEQTSVTTKIWYRNNAYPFFESR